MKITAIADNHGFHRRITVPAADVLAVAGDISPQGTLADIEEFGKWLQKLDGLNLKINGVCPRNSRPRN